MRRISITLNAGLVIAVLFAICIIAIAPVMAVDGTASTDGQSNIVIFGNSQGAYHQPSGTDYSTLGGSSAIRRDGSIDTFYDPFVWYLRGYNNTEWVAVTQYAAIAKGGCLVTGYSAEPVDPKEKIPNVEYTCKPSPTKQYVGVSPYMIQPDEGSGWPVIYQDTTGETHIGMQGLMGPVPVSKGKYPTGTGWNMIASSPDHALGLRDDGTVAGWGSSAYGSWNLPSDVKYTDIAVGRYFSLALSTNGTIFAAGYDEDGQVSDKPSGSGYIAIEANNYTAAALDQHGQIKTWGKPRSGVQNSDEEGYSDIALDSDYLIAIKESGPELEISGELSPGPEHTILTVPNSRHSQYSIEIPFGSFIEHSDHGITRIRAPNGTQIGWTNDRLATVVAIPGGVQSPGTWVHEFPSNSKMRYDNDGKLIVNSSQGTHLFTASPPHRCPVEIFSSESETNAGDIYTGYIEYAHQENVDDLTDFTAYWTVPSAPDSSTPSNSYISLWNGVGSKDGNAIVQPVLEWDHQDTGKKWTIAAWSVPKGNCGSKGHSDRIDTSVGNKIKGKLHYSDSTNGWQIDIGDETQGKTTSCSSNVVSNTDVEVFGGILEGRKLWHNQGDKNMPGTSEFYDMSYDVTVSLTGFVNSEAQKYFNSLQAEIVKDPSKVKLHTAN